MALPSLYGTVFGIQRVERYGKMPFFQEFCKDIHKNAGPVLLIQLAGGILASKLAAPVSIVGIVYSAAGTAIDAVDAQNVVAVRIGCVFLQRMTIGSSIFRASWRKCGVSNWEAAWPQRLHPYRMNSGQGS